MKQRLRHSMSLLHSWLGVLLGWLLYFMFVTGTVGYFDGELDRWMRPELPLTTHRSLPDIVELAQQRLQHAAPHAERWRIDLLNRNTENELRISWRMPAGAGGDGPHSETLLAPPSTARSTGGGQALYQLHYHLHYMATQKGYWITGFAALCLLVALVTGVIAHRKIFKDFFAFRPDKGQRSWLDAHNVMGVIALPFHLMITYSGLVLLMLTYMPWVLTASYGFDEEREVQFFEEMFPVSNVDVSAAGVPAPLLELKPLIATLPAGGALRSITIHHPGDHDALIVVLRERDTPLSGTDRLIYDGVSGALLTGPPALSTPRKVNDALIGLHEGLFAGPGLRWLYFFSGLLGAGLIATGLIHWTLKRRARSHEVHGGVVLVERLNSGVLVGLPIAIAAYFWANRLISVTAPHRSDWEMHTLFIVWAITLLYSACRAPQHAWRELLWLAAAAYLLLPLLNALTTARHLGVTLAHDGWRGDWALAGVDLSMLGFGVLFMVLALRCVRWSRKQLQARIRTATNELHLQAVR